MVCTSPVLARVLFAFPLQLSQGIHDNIGLVCGFAQPENDLIGLLVYVAHLSDLMPSLLVVFLIDANAIRPYYPIAIP